MLFTSVLTLTLCSSSDVVEWCVVSWAVYRRAEILEIIPACDGCRIIDSYCGQIKDLSRSTSYFFDLLQFIDMSRIHYSS